MDSKLCSTIFVLLFLSWSPKSLSEDMTILDNLGENIVAGFLEQESEDGGHEDDGMECIQMLMPCGPYMHSSSPPAICCNPLKDVIKTDTHCLCKASNDPQIKKNFNITLDQALALPKACGIQLDSSVCKNATTPSSSPTTPTSTPNDSEDSGSRGSGIRGMGGMTGGPTPSPIVNTSSNSSSSSSAGVTFNHAFFSYKFVTFGALFMVGAFHL